MKLQRILLLICPLFIPFSLSHTSGGKKPNVKVGIEVLRDGGFKELQGKRVGLITNPTGITSSFQQTIDVLYVAPGVRLAALFGPEHGVRGDVEAGKYVENYTDEKTKLPVYSLYGKNRKPTAQMLQGLDVLVYDIQDIGVRSYTYISTMGYAMEAAAENGIAFMVLDRPNPLTGVRVEGTMLDLRHKSFVGMYPIPYVYGMTAGELAQMINAEGWLNNGKRCELTVIPIEGWNRKMWWDETGLPWVPPSPHIPHASTPLFYVMTGLLGELGTANQGVGYTLPFELVGAPWIDGPELARYLKAQGIQGVEFRPLTYKPFYFDTTGQTYRGIQIHVTDRDRLDLAVVQFSILEALYRLYPDRNIFERARPERIQMFDKVNGTEEVRRMLTENRNVDDLLRIIDVERAKFAIKRDKYLIYE
ncbi:MAG: DUF1343 domain-containing protein [Ignavibacteriales bacterium]|nr:DUF1343 domain-containing protein [Ignavibacteriales bacterium]